MQDVSENFDREGTIFKERVLGICMFRFGNTNIASPALNLEWLWSDFQSDPISSTLMLSLAAESHGPSSKSQMNGQIQERITGMSLPETAMLSIFTHVSGRNLRMGVLWGKIARTTLQAIVS